MMKQDSLSATFSAVRKKVVTDEDGESEVTFRIPASDVAAVAVLQQMPKMILRVAVVASTQ